MQMKERRRRTGRRGGGREEVAAGSGGGASLSGVAAAAAATAAAPLFSHACLTRGIPPLSVSPPPQLQQQHLSSGGREGSDVRVLGTGNRDSAVAIGLGGLDATPPVHSTHLMSHFMML